MNNCLNSTVQAKRCLPVRLLALLCTLMLLVGVLPLYAISFYNHPYYDDYKFSASVHKVWVETHNPLQVLATAWQSAQAARLDWQGTYTGTLLSNVQPGVFSEGLYWLTTFILLTAFLLCFGFLFKTIFRNVLGAGRAETVCITCLSLFLMTQFLPSANEAFFWFNGGIGNTFIYSLLALSLALMIRLTTAKRGAPWLAAGLLVLTTLLGGGSYGGGLFGLIIFAVICVYAFYRKNRHRFIYAGLTVWFMICFAYNIAAPGNAVRAAIIGVHPSAVKAVLLSLYYGVALVGNYLTLPVLTVALALAPLLWRLTKKSTFSFRHPVLVLLTGVCLFCAQLTPPIYGGVSLGGWRILDTYYFSFIVMLLLYETYALGAFARYRERQGKPELTLSWTAQRGLLIASACLFLLGCFGYKHSDDTLYGPMNMAGGSAALSMASGEASQYDREMTAREKLLQDANQPTVTLSPLTAVPEVFMADLLIPDSAYDVRPMLCAYYGKTAVLLEGGDGT